MRGQASLQTPTTTKKVEYVYFCKSIAKEGATLIMIMTHYENTALYLLKCLSACILKSICDRF